MLKLEMNIRMPKSCSECPFYMGSRGGGDCIATYYSLYFAGVDVAKCRHEHCPLEEVEENA